MNKNSLTGKTLEIKKKLEKIAGIQNYFIKKKQDRMLKSEKEAIMERKNKIEEIQGYLTNNSVSLSYVTISQMLKTFEYHVKEKGTALDLTSAETQDEEAKINQYRSLMTEVAEKDLKELKNAIVSFSVDKSKVNNRPSIIIEEDVLKQATKYVIDYQVEEDVETAGLFRYERVDKGLHIVEMEEIRGLTRKKGSVVSSLGFHEDSGSIEEKKIPFHSHPERSYVMLSGDEEELTKDIQAMFAGITDGIQLIGKPSQLFDYPVIWGAQALKAEKGYYEEGVETPYLPIHVVKNGKKVDEKFEFIEIYNKMLNLHSIDRHYSTPYVMYKKSTG